MEEYILIMKVLQLAVLVFCIVMLYKNGKVINDIKRKLKK